MNLTASQALVPPNETTTVHLLPVAGKKKKKHQNHQKQKTWDHVFGMAIVQFDQLAEANPKGVKGAPQTKLRCFPKRTWGNEAMLFLLVLSRECGNKSRGPCK